jgi:hypothetical protein
MSYRFDNNQLSMLSADACRGLRADQTSAFGLNNSTICASLSTNCIGAMTSSAVSTIQGQCAASLSCQSLEALYNANTLTSLSRTAIGSLTSDQITCVSKLLSGSTLCWFAENLTTQQTNGHDFGNCLKRQNKPNEAALVGGGVAAGLAIESLILIAVVLVLRRRNSVRQGYTPLNQ